MSKLLLSAMIVCSTQLAFMSTANAAKFNYCANCANGSSIYFGSPSSFPSNYNASASGLCIANGSTLVNVSGAQYVSKLKRYICWKAKSGSGSQIDIPLKAKRK